MKVFVQDDDVYGVIIVISDNIENARNKMKLYFNYNKHGEIKAYELNEFEYSKPGLCL